MTATKTDIQQLTEFCICCICSDYITDLRETPCCHQLLCLTCVQTYFNQSVKNCPLCKHPSLTEDSLLTNVLVQRLIDNLQLDCPYKLEGCPAKVARCDLIKHKQLCEYSPEKLANKQQQKLNELKPLLRKYNDPKSSVDDKTLYDLAKLLFEQHEYTQARQCFQKMKTRNCLFETIILQAHIERDDGQFDDALRFYNQANSLVESIRQRIELHLAEGHTFFEMAKYTEAKDAFTRALQLLSNDNPLTTQKKAEILNAIGRVAKKCSDYKQALSFYQKALDLVDTPSDLSSAIVSNLADIHRKKGNYEKSLELYLKALSQKESLYGQNHPSTADIMNNLGMLFKKQGQYNKGLDYLKQALKISKFYHGEQHPSIGIYLTNIGDIHRKLGDFKTAEATYKIALATLEKSYGPDHIEVAEVLNSMGLVMKKRADYDGAEAHYKRAIQIVHDTFGHDQEHYKLGIFYNNLADLDRKRRKFDNALQLYKRALTAIKKTLGSQHSEAAEILHNIGQVQHELGNYMEAISFIKQALVIIEKEFSCKHYKYGMFINSLGLAYAMINDYKAAYDHSKQALQILIDCLGQDHPEVCDVNFNLGDYCMKLVDEIDSLLRTTYVIENLNERMLKLREAKNYYTEAQRIAQATFGPEHTKAKQLLSLLFIVDNYSILR